MKLTAFLAVVGAAGWLFFQNQFRSKLRATVEDKFNEVLTGTGVQTSIGGAQFVDGKGMLLSDMRATAPNVSLTAYETFLAMDSTATDLVTGNSQVDGVEMRRVQLQVFRTPDGKLDLSAFSKIAQAIEIATQGKPKRLIPITLLDSQVRLIDQSANIDKTVSDINISITPVLHQSRVILEIIATAAAAEVQQVMLKGFVDPHSGEWNAELTLNNANVSSELLALLPREIQREIGSTISYSSRANGQFQASGNWQSNQFHWFEGSGQIADIAIHHQKLPDDVHNGALEFSFSPNGATLSNVTGRMGTASFAAHFNCVDLLNPKNWRLVGRMDQFKLDRSEKTLRSMPPSTQRLLKEFQASGTFDTQFDINFDGNQIIKTIDAQISDLSFNFSKFPYPMSDCVGTVRWVDEKITYELRNETRDRVLTAKGFVNNPSKGATWRCDMNTERGQLEFDHSLRKAIDANPPLAKVVREFNAHGWVAASGTIQRPVPDGEIQKRFDIDIINMAINHSRFPYRIENVKGRVSSINKSVQFKDFTGSKGDGRIQCNGSFSPQKGLDVHFVCSNIELNGELRQALRPELKEVWDGFRPRGKAESMAVFMAMPPGQKECNIVLQSTLNGENNGLRTSDLSIFPTWFPYKLENLAGILVVGNGKIQLRKFRGQHGRTTVSCNGDGSYSPSGWDISFSDLLTRSLRTDEPLLRALPESLARPIQFMKFDGLLNVNGKMTLAGRYRKPKLQQAHAIPHQPLPQTHPGSFAQQASAIESVDTNLAPRISMGWDLRFDMNQAELFLGIPLKNVFGKFNLIGQYDGENVECRGSVDFDSLTIYDAQITKIRGPIWIDNYQTLAGGMINELSTGRTSPSIEGEMYGGTIKLDAAISSDSEGRFVINTSLADGNLKQFTQEFSPNLENVDGHTFAALRIYGDATGTHTCRGNGQIHLRDAKIYELPRVARLLKPLQGRKLDDVLFDSGDIFFDVNGENIDINRMEFNGDAISIIGNGRMNLDHDLDLNFYSVVGRNRLNIPLISDIYRRSSQKFMWINVTGTSQNPKISNEILPELNDSLRQLFGQENRQAQFGLPAEQTVYPNSNQR